MACQSAQFKQVELDAVDWLSDDRHNSIRIALLVLAKRGKEGRSLPCSMDGRSASRMFVFPPLDHLQTPRRDLLKAFQHTTSYACRQTH